MDLAWLLLGTIYIGKMLDKSVENLWRMGILESRRFFKSHLNPFPFSSPVSGALCL